MRICPICNKEFEIISKFAHSRIYCYNCSPVSTHKNSQVAQTRRNMKKALVERKGGACERCGYNKCMDALEFHHLDPNQKEIAIGDIAKSSSNWGKIQLEVDKCILVCANCHKEIHAGL